MEDYIEKFVISLFNPYAIDPEVLQQILTYMQMSHETYLKLLIQFQSTLYLDLGKMSF